ncbi:hypothetical protein DYY67_1384 [Candidatus Nitrosotalea sp. TS]|uniref:CIS tube protein n=1 Tax=Candidatus Nitrosotalea sp. TS TaxID=2341020 RepID=UPI0014078770|nr:hypothetical protein [Candidatus Nitrosotalea sp. TS]NHI03589.1 hypothetical protein [Candidatus Nitrosotalea sp. TS]
MSTQNSGYTYGAAHVLQKGAFIVLGDNPNVIQFQFNPESLTRTLKRVTPSVSGDSSGESDESTPSNLKTNSFLGESMKIVLLLDGYEDSTDGGVLPLLSAIEQLLNPVDSTQGSTAADYRDPPREILEVIFVWGGERILPVKITSIEVEETDFSPSLVPIRAKVTIGMEMLIPDVTKDLSSKMVAAYQQNQNKRDSWAQNYYQNTVTSLPSIADQYTE